MHKKAVFLAFLITTSSSCTYSINMVHTSGEASDVIDEEQAPKADLHIPINDLPFSGAHPA